MRKFWNQPILFVQQTTLNLENAAQYKWRHLGGYKEGGLWYTWMKFQTSLIIDFINNELYPSYILAKLETVCDTLDIPEVWKFPSVTPGHRRMEPTSPQCGTNVSGDSRRVKVSTRQRRVPMYQKVSNECLLLYVDLNHSTFRQHQTDFLRAWNKYREC